MSAWPTLSAINSVNWWGIPTIAPDLDAECEFVLRKLKQAGKTEYDRKVRLVKPQIGINFIGNQFFTDGKACVISMR
jgi:hypothetical protein